MMFFLSVKTPFVFCVCKEVPGSSGDGGVIDLKILMKLEAFNVLLCDLSCSIADVKIQGKSYSNTQTLQFLNPYIVCDS